MDARIRMNAQTAVSSSSGTADAKSDPFRDELLRLLLEREQQRDLSQREIVPRADRHSPAALSYAQEQLWFLEQVGMAGTAYNIPLALRLQGKLDQPALQRSLSELVQRHESLRTRFLACGGVVTQSVQVVEELALACYDLSSLDEMTREDRLRELMQNERLHRFDLTVGTLIRAALVRMDEGDHALLLTMHHIVCDGWSVGIIVRELSALYSARVSGAPSPLADLPVQYADFSLWQREALQSGLLDAHRDYWRAQLDGFQSLQLQTDRARPDRPSLKGAVIRFEVPQQIAVKLAELARGEGVTLYMALLAAFGVLLSRHSGQTDIVIGSPVAGRSQQRTEGIVGSFVNMLVMRLNVSQNPPLRSLLQRVKDAALGAYEHQELPFETLVAAIRPEREVGRHPIFQVTFSLQNFPQEDLQLPGIKWSRIPAEHVTAQLDLGMHLAETPTGLLGQVEYATDLFDRATIDGLIGQYQRLLDSIVSNPECRVRQLPMLSPSERIQLLEDWCRGTVSSAEHSYIHELVTQQARRSPEAIAIAFGAERVTYGELELRSTRLARRLQALGVGPERVAALYLERSIDLVVAILGVLKVGGAYLPIDSSTPAERVRLMLQDARAGWVLIHAETRDRCPIGIGAALVAVQEPEAPWPPDSDILTPPRLIPQSCAYVIYTSGSTGQPKGAMITHQGLTNYLRWAAECYKQSGRGGSLLHSSIAFDATITALFLPLLAGETLHCVPPADELSALAGILSGPCDDLLLKVTPAHLDAVRPLLRAGSRSGPLRFVIGGEELTAKTLRPWMEWAPEARFFNEYGPTETVVGCVVQRVTKNELASRVPIGRPIDNTAAYVLDEHLEPVPPGMIGGLYIGGPGVARGYINRPGLTAARFIPNPFGELGSRLYDTGDLVRYRADGTLEYLGRADRQIKLRGHRIELPEIEAVMLSHLEVMQAAVLLCEGPSATPHLTAYVVSRAESFDPQSLRDHLAHSLPEHMIPAQFHRVAQMPLTINGKVDRAALLAATSQPLLKQSYVAPSNDLQAKIAAVWQHVLGLDRVGIEDDFFHIGGDSILSLQVVARSRELGVHFSPRQLYALRTIARLMQAATLVARHTPDQETLEGQVELTPILKWFIAKQFRSPSHWNQALLLEAREPVVPEALERAVQAIVRHHDALRLRLSPRDGEWQAWIAGHETAPTLARIDLSQVLPSMHREEIERLATHAQSSFDLEQGPIVRFVWFDLGPDHASRLLMAVHHVASDAVSLQLLLEDLCRAYVQARANEPIALPPKTNSYATWSRRLNRYASDAALEYERDYWERVAAAAAASLECPRDFEGQNVVSTTRIAKRTFSRELTTDLLQVAPVVYGCTHHDVLVTALSAAYRRWTQADSLVFDMEGHGRQDVFDDLDVSRTVGWFTSIYPVHIDLREYPDRSRLLGTVARTIAGLPQNGFSYGVLRYLTSQSPSGPIARARSARLCFNNVGQFGRALTGDTPFQFAKESAGDLFDANELRYYDIIVGTMISENLLYLNILYSSSLHRDDTMESLADLFSEELRLLIGGAGESARTG